MIKKQKEIDEPFIIESVDIKDLINVNFNKFKNYKNFIIGEVHRKEMIDFYDKLLENIKPEYFICELCNEDECLNLEILLKKLNKITNGKFLKNIPDYQDNWWCYNLAYKHGCKLVGCNPISNKKFKSMDEECKVRETYMLETLKKYEGKTFVCELGNYHLRSIPITNDYCEQTNQSVQDESNKRNYNVTVSFSSPIYDYFKEKSNVIIYKIL